MREPFDGKVNKRLIYKKYKNTIFYYVERKKDGFFAIVPCILRYSYHLLTISKFDENWNLENSSFVFRWENLFSSREEALIIAEEYNKRISAFRYRPHLTNECIEKHFKELKETEYLIDKLLGSFENYDGIDFCDVHANGIQVRIHHKKIKGYTYGAQVTIKYDFSNLSEIPYLVARAFIESDKEDLIADELHFIEQGEKFGWD